MRQTSVPSANVHGAAEYKQRNKQMVIEYNNSYVLSIWLNVSTSPGHHQAGITTF